MKGRLAFVFGIFLICMAHMLSWNEAVEFKFTNAVCESWNKTNILVEVQMFKKANGYKPWLIKTAVDACRFVKKSYNPFAILVYNLFKEFSNINHTCPYMIGCDVKRNTVLSEPARYQCVGYRFCCDVY
ncbi:uncharacterized protein LOC132784004 [Drosophila nasuta]|uniref:uncharacterized protein LOC132784004 n=1 Tax=Drosophila nasuta TaxID=42062 RepID=UPI00295E6832|nr:uncharacterized protein LOC132784004 [Drosophila nasuta]